jgi:membrane protease YdiL (CAAX protease family)
MSTPIPADPPSLPRWRRYASVAGALALLFVVQPVIALVLDRRLGALTDLGSRAVLVVLLAVLFTVGRGWRANGFLGGLQWRWWLALWPIWGVTALVLALSPVRSVADHLSWLLFAFFVGFTEEAVFRGIILRALLPGGTRSAIFWSAFWFAAAHLPWLALGVDPRMALLVVAEAFTIGLVFACVRIASGSIWPGIVAHAAFDDSALIYHGGVQSSLEYSSLQALTTVLFVLWLLFWTGSLLSLWPKAARKRRSLAAAAEAARE